MKKIFLILISVFAASLVVAQEIKFQEDPVWAKVIDQAQKEKKIIFFDAYATWCGPCKQMDADTYTDKSVADFYNENFINVKYDMEKGEGPTLADRFFVNAYPNLIFISPEGNILHKAVGFKTANEFLALGKEAKDPKMQYYTLKKNALKFNTKDFLAFAKQAVGFEDEDFLYLSQDYLAAQPDILGDSYLIDLVMNYISGLPSEKDIAYFKESKTKVLREGKYTDDDFQNRMVSFVLQYVLSEKIQVAEEVDFSVVQSLLEKYVPEEAFMALNFYKAQFEVGNEDFTGAASTLNLMINSPDKVQFQQLCNAMIMFAPALYQKVNLDELLTKFNALKLAEADKDLDYMKDFVKSIIYYKTSQLDKFKAIAPTILANKNTPEEVKDNLKTALEKLNTTETKP